MKKHTPLKIWDSLFLMQYYVSYGVSRGSVKKAVKETLGVDIPKDMTLIGTDGHAIHYKAENGEVAIWIWTIRKDVEILVHECFHAMSYTMQAGDIPLNRSTEEVYVYALEMLVHAILEKQ